MRVAIAQLNPTVGDVAGNTRLIESAMNEAKASGAGLLVTSELAIIGYPPRDLLLRAGVVEACEAAVGHLARLAGDLTVVIGSPRRNVDDGSVHGLRNSAAICARGEIVAWYDKRLLPGYDVFDEDRYFDPGRTPGIVDLDGRRLGVLTCEDLWSGADNDAAPSSYAESPIDALAEASCDLVVVLNASPFTMHKPERHRTILREAAKRLAMTIVAVNQVGANDDLIFDGRSAIVRHNGAVLHECLAWSDTIDVVDLKDASTIEPRRAMFADDVTRALSLGVRDYVRKSGHDGVLLGLSGGIDSAVTATIAVLALGPHRVTGVLMPSRYSSDHSLRDARDLAARLGMVEPVELPIREAHASVRGTVSGLLGETLDGLPDENIQARLRGLILMTISNATNRLVLATGNKSELAVGYSTLYGDMCGAISVIGDLLKTHVYDVARWINEAHAELGFIAPPIPESTITKPPSAELRADQTDQDSLPPYDLLDAVIHRYVDSEASTAAIIDAMPEHADLVRRWTRLIDMSQYKRDQASVILKVSPRTFGRGRPMPIVIQDTSSNNAVDKLSTPCSRSQPARTPVD